MNFLIVRLSSLGDIIHTLPAFAALRQQFPAAKINWVVEEKGKEILDLVPGIDRIYVQQTKNRTLKSFRKLIQELRSAMKEKDSVALDFQGLIKSGLFTRLSGAKKRLGFDRSNCREPQASYFYTKKAEAMPETIHVIQKNLNLLRLLEINENKFTFPLSIPDALSTSIRNKLEILNFKKTQKLILLNVGAAWETKRWFEDRWVKFIEIIKNRDLFPVLLWGTDSEKSLADNISERSGIPLLPSLSLREVIALIKQSALLVTGDTFALQAAGALNRVLQST